MLNVNKTLFQKNDLRNEYISALKRKMPIPPLVIKQLKSWHHIHNQIRMKSGNVYKDFNFIFSDKPDKPDPARISGINLILFKKAGVPKITPHGLRHTHTALLIEAKKTVPGIQLRVGHASIKATLNVYLI
ncbi:tyrosine-type recombinase/integrase [Peribacillus sp. SIMBA_075]|uniref:tyrosine-type recombinase/integrase n=1 Tax=Peribacillus sp. SIMBA_075 TaxID=3085813 RepID=UPI003978D75A